MPYKLVKRDGKYCVDNSETGESKGCSSTRAMAVRHMRALYAHEKKGKDDEVNALVAKAVADFEIESGETEDKSYMDYPVAAYSSATSYSELFSQRDAAEQEREITAMIYEFPSLASNIMYDPEITDKAGAIRSLAGELADLLNSETSQESEEDKGKQRDNVVKSAIEAAVNYVKELFSKDKSGNDGDLLIWKDLDDGKWHWMARYSNSFRDKDTPPEIITTKSHRRFVELVDKGLAPYPSLWVWHQREWEIGKATWVAVDETSEKSVFALAAGYFYDGCEEVADWLSKKEGVRMSHGMPKSSIVRDSEDSTLIIEHETREISVLPAWVAANELTGFMSFQEADMAIPANKRKQLIEDWKIPSDMLDAVENLNASDSSKAIEEQIETKDTPAEEISEVSQESTTPAAEPVAEAATGEVSQDFPTRDEVVEALRVVTQVVEGLSKDLTELQQMVKTIAEVQVGQQKQAEQLVKQTPKASILSMLRETDSAIGDKSTLVKQGSALDLLKPKEAEARPLTGISFIDEMIGKK